MKKFGFAVYLLFLACAVVPAQPVGMNSLVGTWEAVTQANESGALEVKDTTTLFLVYGAEKLPIISYTADFTKSPCWFDFKVKSGADTLCLKSLLLFVNNNLVQWQIFEDDGDARPVYFSSSKGDMVFLKRKALPEEQEAVAVSQQPEGE